MFPNVGVALHIGVVQDRGVVARRGLVDPPGECPEAGRRVDGDEGIFSTDMPVDWMNYRRAGGSYGSGYGGSFGAGWGGDCGVLGYGFNPVSFSDGSAY